MAVGPDVRQPHPQRVWLRRHPRLRTVLQGEILGTAEYIHGAGRRIAESPPDEREPRGFDGADYDDVQGFPLDAILVGNTAW